MKKVTPLPEWVTAFLFCKNKKWDCSKIEQSQETKVKRKLLLRRSFFQRTT